MNSNDLAISFPSSRAVVDRQVHVAHSVYGNTQRTCSTSNGDVVGCGNSVTDVSNPNYARLIASRAPSEHETGSSIIWKHAQLGLKVRSAAPTVSCVLGEKEQYADI